ncbi:MAG: serine/threonine protein kinase [Microcoleus vaginatus WJT46-NPBG5]|jgi:WD40 repeat protein/predicted Ser/Thr protein kinase|nr:serine/threonine protein kinase [Microcoleus vaginatus WJT46-NPBG5]
MIGQLLDRRYRITEVIGSAEFGQTYLAKDTRRPGHPECFVKHLKPSSHDPQMLETTRRLFDKEAEILEKLGQHDQIPQLFAYFEENKEFYLVEEFIPGHSLGNEILTGQPLTENQVVNILREVLEILVFVHGHGVIHRDIKPSNLIRRHPDNKLVLIDFGAVKEIGSQFAQRQMPPTMRIGTLEYMPVEQFQYNPQLNSDLYALGMIAIQGLTGLPIYDLPKLRDNLNPNKGELSWRHLALVSVELAEILDKMVRYDYRQRYQSATEVLADLIKITDRSGIQVPKLTIYREEVERRASSRGGISVVGRSILDALRSSLELPPEDAEEIEEEVLKPYQDYKQKFQRYQQALTEAMNQEYPLSQDTRDELKRLQQVLGLRDEDIAKIEEKVPTNFPRFPQFKLPQRLPNLGQKDPRLIGSVIGAVLAFFALIYAGIKLQQFFQQQQRETSKLTALNAFYKEGDYDSCIKEASNVSQSSNQYQPAQNLLKQCQAGLNWKNVQFQTLTGHSDAVGVVTFNSDSTILASGSKDKTIKLWDVAAGKLNRTLEGDSSAVWAMAFSPDSTQLATGSFFWRVLLWNLNSGELIRTVEHDAAVWTVAISPNGKTLVSGSEDKKIKVWNLETGKRIYTLSDHSDYVYSVAISRDGKTLVSGSKDATVKIWELGTGTLIDTLADHSADVRSVAISPDSQTIVSGSYDNTIKVWNQETGELIRTLEGHSDDVVSVAISPDGKTIASGSKDKTIKIWNLATGELLNTLSGHSDEVYSVAFSSDGKMLASAGKDNSIKLWRR